MSLSHFAHPLWLAFLIVPALLVAGYVYAQRLRHKHVLRFTNLDLLETVAPKRPGLERHVPTALLAVGLVLLTVALAGPTREQRVPRNRATVVMAIDVSLSMEATDVTPNRLEAAQEAAKNFAEGLTPGINLGLVTFAGTASVLVSPTTDRLAVTSAIDRLRLDERTATGEAIFTSMQAIETISSRLPGEEPPPAHIVLLSDGKQTVPPELDDVRGAYTAAREAASREIPVSTISFGTPLGTVEIEGERIPVPVDDESLMEIAKLSGGEFYSAASLEELSAVYETLEEQIGYETTRGDASRPWLILGTVLISAAAGSALVLTRRLP